MGPSVDSKLNNNPLLLHPGSRGPLTYCRREYQSLRWFRRQARRIFFTALRASLTRLRRVARSLRSQKKNNNLWHPGHSYYVYGRHILIVGTLGGYRSQFTHTFARLSTPRLNVESNISWCQLPIIVNNLGER